MEQLTLLKPWIPSITGFIVALIILTVYNRLIAKYSERFKAHLSQSDSLAAEQILDLLNDFRNPIRVVLLISSFYIFTQQAPIHGLADIRLFDKLLRSSIVICLFWGIYNTTDNASVLLDYTLKKAHINSEPALINLFQGVLRFLVCFMGSYVVAREWDFDVSAFLASLSIGSLAFAFAAKDALANVFGSIVVLIEKPFKTGDWIVINGIEGTVEDITFRSTMIRAFTDELISVPNSLLTNAPIYNMSRRGKQRIRFNLGVTYSSTAEQLETGCQRIKEWIEQYPLSVKDPGKIRVHFYDFNDSSLDIRIDFYVSTGNFYEYLECKNDVNLAMMHILEECGLSCAFPSRSIYFESPVTAIQEEQKAKQEASVK